MANVIIGIHGLGNKPPKHQLEHWWKLAMEEGLENNNYKVALPKFEMVYWADILCDKPLSEDEKNPESPYFMDETYTKATKNTAPENHNIRKKFVDFMRKQLNKIFLNEDLTLNYSFITDTLVDRYFKELEMYYSEINIGEGRKVRDLIRERLYAVLKKYKRNDIMLISHSMGSIIAFDVLTFLSPHIRINTFVTIGSPLGLPVVIGKIAAEQKRKHNNENHMITPPGIVKNWFNFSDILDKVAFNYALADDFAANNSGIKPVDFLVENNYKMNGEHNPHKSYGYLRTPEFSKVLNEFILAEKLNLKTKIMKETIHLIDFLKTNLIQKQKTEPLLSPAEEKKNQD
jgi:hypothetical protein